MNPDNVYKYIYTGSIFNEDEKLYRKTCFGPFLLTLLAGLTPGGILKGFWPFLSLAMVVVSLACGIAVFVLASDFLTVKEALRLDVITTVAWVFDFSILNIMCFTMLKGFTPWVLLINLPVVLIPLFVGIIIYRALKKPDYNPKETAKSNLKFSFFSSFFSYISLSIVLDRISTNVEQRTAIIIVLLCFSIVNVFMSLGFLSLQKLYYIKKFKINL
jgi:hypothetical protein